jgi:hypothetical protein
MKRRTMLVLLTLALLAATPGWAAPAHTSADQVFFGWLGTIWADLWGAGGRSIEPPATGAAPLTRIWARTGGCVDPNGRPSPCPPKPQQGGCVVDGSCAQ